MGEQQELNIEESVESIAGDLGLGKTDNTEVDTGTSAADEQTQTAAATTTTTEKKTEDATTQAAATVRAAPKAWPKEKHEIWSKLPPDAQEYLELREKQVLDGIGQYSDKAKRADEWESAVKDYMPLIEAQGAKPQEAVRYLFEAHKRLSSGTPEQRAQYLALVAKTYGIDFAKAATASTTEEPQSVRELRERTERLEREREQELRARDEEVQRRVAGEVQTFADAKDDKGNLKHPYFDECATHIVALIHAGHTLEEAYEQAVWANPVTREKERVRLQTEQEAALRAKAKKEAETARHASRTNVNSRDTRRQPTAPKAKKWEDTLEQTYQEIQERTH